MVACGTDLHPLDARRRMGAVARPCAGARRATRQGVPRRHDRARADQRRVLPNVRPASSAGGFDPPV